MKCKLGSHAYNLIKLNHEIKPVKFFAKNYIQSLWFVLSISRGCYGLESDMIASKAIILMTNTTQVLRKVLYNLTRTQRNTI